MNDPILFRGIERIIISLGGILCLYLGYRLYIFGISEGKSKVEFKTEWAKLVVGGVGPGIVFAALGTITLMVLVFYGGASSKEEVQVGHEKRMEDILRRWEQLDQGKIPKDTYLVYPSNWKEIAKRATMSDESDSKSDDIRTTPNK